MSTEERQNVEVIEVETDRTPVQVGTDTLLYSRNVIKDWSRRFAQFIEIATDKIDKTISVPRDFSVLIPSWKNEITLNSVTADAALFSSALVFALSIAVMVSLERARDKRLYGESDDYFFVQLIALQDHFNTQKSTADKINLLAELFDDDAATVANGKTKAEKAAAFKAALEHHGDHHRFHWKLSTEYQQTLADFEKYREEAIQKLKHQEKSFINGIFTNNSFAISNTAPDKNEKTPGFYLYWDNNSLHLKVIDGQLNPAFNLTEILGKTDKSDLIPEQPVEALNQENHQALIDIIQSTYLNHYVTVSMALPTFQGKLLSTSISFLMVFWATWYGLWEITGAMGLASTLSIGLAFGLPLLFLIPLLIDLFTKEKVDLNIENRKDYINRRLIYTDDYFQQLSSLRAEKSENITEFIDAIKQALNDKNNWDKQESQVEQAIERLKKSGAAMAGIDGISAAMYAILIPLYVYWPISLLLIKLGVSASVLAFGLAQYLTISIALVSCLFFGIRSAWDAYFQTHQELLALINEKDTQIKQLSALERKNSYLEAQIKSEFADKYIAAIEHLGAQDDFFRKMSLKEPDWGTYAKKFLNRFYQFECGAILGILLIRFFCVPGALLVLHSPLILAAVALTSGFLYGAYNCWRYDRAHKIERDKRVLNEAGLRIYAEEKKQAFLINQLATYRHQSQDSSSSSSGLHNLPNSPLDSRDLSPGVGRRNSQEFFGQQKKSQITKSPSCPDLHKINHSLDTHTPH